MSKLAVILAAAAVLGGLAIYHERLASARVNAAVEADRSHWRGEAARAQSAANVRVANVETAAAVAMLEVTHEFFKAREAARASASLARDESGRLRDAIAALRRGGGAPGASDQALTLTDAAPALADALSECSERYATVAETADQLSTQVTGLQAYVDDVLTPAGVLARP